MIAYLDGTITGLESDGVLLEVSGVGYRVFVARQKCEVGDRIRFWISEIIREDKHDLYGFSDRSDQALFEEFMGVSGVGPKLAQKILASGSAEEIIRHIHADDVTFFNAISGVGKKTAQKIILDLKGVLVLEEKTEAGSVQSDVADALESLGYSKADISGIAKDITGETTESRVKSALKLLSRHV